MNTAIILAGGTGVRVGAKVPKQFIEVLGRPVISYTLDIYCRSERQRGRKAKIWTLFKQQVDCLPKIVGA